MNEDLVKERARARRFDAELAGVLHVAVGAASAASCSVVRRATTWWWAAALALLGLATAVVASRRGAGPEPAPAQDPAPLDPVLVGSPIPCVQRDTELTACSRDVQGMRLLLLPESRLKDDLAALAPFTSLRMLAITGPQELTGDALVALAALGGLQRIEELELTVGERITAVHLRALARLPRLRLLSLHLSRPWSEADVDALVEWPSLASVRVGGGRLGPEVVARFARLPGLRQLALVGGGDVPEDALLALAHVRQLRSVRLEAMGPSCRPSLLAGERPLAHSAGLTVRVADALQRLPSLRQLVLDDVQTSAEALERLPPMLEHVGVLCCPQLPARAFVALARLPHLRCLELDAGDREALWGNMPLGAAEAKVGAVFAAAPPREPVWAAQAALLRRVAPRELRWSGPMPADVREVVAELPLTSLSWVRAPRGALSLLAELSGLTSFTLSSCPLEDVDVARLAALPHLRSLCVQFVTWPAAELRARLPGVTVTTHGF